MAIMSPKMAISRAFLDRSVDIAIAEDDRGSPKDAEQAASRGSVNGEHLYLLEKESEKFGFTQAKSGITPRAYAQTMFRHARAAEMNSVYNQLMACWNELDLAFQMQISEPTATTTMGEFLETLDSRASICARMAERKADKPREYNDPDDRQDVRKVASA